MILNLNSNMISNNTLVYSGKIIVELIGDILYFPLWWYARGMTLFAGKLLAILSDRQKSLALWVWIKNIHRPMYGQYDWQGMLISFFMRLIQIIFRSFVMLIWLIIILAIFITYLILPIFVFYEILFQLNV